MHVMIDLETMGTRPNAPIIAIGAVTFDTVGILDTFYCNIDLESAVNDSHAVVDPKTVLWWMEQGGEARSALRENKLRVIPALCDFRDWLKPYDPDGVWGNGASFDNIILSETYRRLNMTPPWEFWKDRCYRTMKGMYPDIPMERTGVHHNALNDAESQANHLIKIWRKGMGR
jgi:hypothetical protein